MKGPSGLKPIFYLWPGFVSFWLPIALLAGLLSAIVERPFLTRAGIKNGTLLHSLRANALSTIASILLIPLTAFAVGVIGLAWCPAAFAVSCVVQVNYLHRFARPQFSLRWVVGGKATSALALIVIPMIAKAIKKSYYGMETLIRPHTMWLAWSGFAVSLVVLLASFVWPLRPTRPKPLLPQ
jgi:hypothetical protein